MSKNIKFTMQQRRMTTGTSYRGIKCLEVLLYVHTSGIGDSILLEIFSDERLLYNQGYDDAGIPLKR